MRQINRNRDLLKGNIVIKCVEHMQFYTHPVGCKVICLRFGFRMGVLVNVNLLVSLPWYINFSFFSFGFSFFLISEREMPPEINFVTVVLLFSKQVATNSS